MSWLCMTGDVCFLIMSIDCLCSFLFFADRLCIFRAFAVLRQKKLKKIKMDNKKIINKKGKKIYKKNYFIRLQLFAFCFVFALVFVLGAFLGILQLCGIICLLFFFLQFAFKKQTSTVILSGWMCACIVLVYGWIKISADGGGTHP